MSDVTIRIGISLRKNTHNLNFAGAATPKPKAQQKAPHDPPHGKASPINVNAFSCVVAQSVDWLLRTVSEGAVFFLTRQSRPWPDGRVVGVQAQLTIEILILTSY